MRIIAIPRVASFQVLSVDVFRWRSRHRLLVRTLNALTARYRAEGLDFFMIDVTLQGDTRRTPISFCLKESLTKIFLPWQCLTAALQALLQIYSTFLSTWENSRLLEWLVGMLQKHYPELGSVESTVWYFWARFSDVISRENQWWRHVMSAIFSGHFFTCSPVKFSKI